MFLVFISYMQTDNKVWKMMSVQVEPEMTKGQINLVRSFLYKNIQI